MADNVNTDELGNLMLTPEEEMALVAFMATLTYGYVPEPPLTLTSEPAAASIDVSGPNPFNPTTTLSYWLPEAGSVCVQVYDTQGRRVASLVDGWQSAGRHEASFSADALASGVYFARMTSRTITASTRLVLVK